MATKRRRRRCDRERKEVERGQPGSGRKCRVSSLDRPLGLTACPPRESHIRSCGFARVPTSRGLVHMVSSSSRRRTVRVRAASTDLPFPRWRRIPVGRRVPPRALEIGGLVAEAVASGRMGRERSNAGPQPVRVGLARGKAKRAVNRRMSAPDCRNWVEDEGGLESEDEGVLS